MALLDAGRCRAGRRRPGQPRQRPRRVARSDRAGPRRLPRHRRRRRPQAVTFLVDNLPAAGRASPSPPGPTRRCRWRACAPAASSSRSGPPTCASPTRRRPRSSTSVMGLGLGAAARGSARSADRGLGSRTPAGRAVGARPSGRDVDGFVEAFAGEPPLRPRLPARGGAATRQPDDVRPFLLDTSVLDELTGDLCDALTGRTRRPADSRGPRAGQPVRRPARRPAAVVPLPPPLRRRAARPPRSQDPDRRPGPAPPAPPAGTPEHGRVLDAIPHAVAGADRRAAGRPRRARACPTCAGSGRTARCATGCGRCPSDVARRRPLLATGLAWVRLSEGDLDGVDDWLDAATQGLGVRPAPDRGDRRRPACANQWRGTRRNCAALPATVEVYRASAAQARGDVPGTVTHARRALELAGPADHLARAGARGLPRPRRSGRTATSRAPSTRSATPCAACTPAGHLADELGATVVLARCGWPAADPTRPGGCTSAPSDRGRTPRPPAVHGGGRARRARRGAARARRPRGGAASSSRGQGARRALVAAREPAPLVHRQRGPDACAGRPGRRGR